jgi:hypothetical protein
MHVRNVVLLSHESSELPGLKCGPYVGDGDFFHVSLGLSSMSGRSLSPAPEGTHLDGRCAHMGQQAYVWI